MFEWYRKLELIKNVDVFEFERSASLDEKLMSHWKIYKQTTSSSKGFIFFGNMYSLKKFISDNNYDFFIGGIDKKNLVVFG